MYSNKSTSPLLNHPRPSSGVFWPQNSFWDREVLSCHGGGQLNCNNKRQFGLVFQEGEFASPKYTSKVEYRDPKIDGLDGERWLG